MVIINETSMATKGPASPSGSTVMDAQRNELQPFSEHRVVREAGSLYVRDFPGNGPAFVLLHGFPDNGHIYDDVIPHLVRAGRRVVTIDFLGFGASDKPQGFVYSFEQQLGDLEAVVETLHLGRIVPVGHDAGGPAAVNFSLRHPDQTASVILMNAFYCDAPGLRMPEFIELFATKKLRALHTEFLKSPEQFAWLLNFQRSQMQIGLIATQKKRYSDFLGPLIDANFRQQPSAGPAFLRVTYQVYDELAANTARMVEFRQSAIPLLLVWGDADPYLHVSAAEYMRGQRQQAVLHKIKAGHWPQIDEPIEVAQAMLTA